MEFIFMIKQSNKKGRQICHGFSLRNPDDPLKKIFYSRFRGIKNRCNNPKHKPFIQYGAKGIKCIWRNFEEFRDDMWNKFILHVEKYGLKNTTIERIDSKGNYCRENCKWATQTEQNNNTNRNHIISFNGFTGTTAEWSRKIGISIKVLEQRLNKLKWSIRETLTTPKCKNQFDRKFKSNN